MLQRAPVTDPHSPLTVRAPGKLVLWGEYAVLEGATAGVMAVNRYAQCRFTPHAHDHWQLSSRGFDAAPVNARAHWLTGRAPHLGHPGRLFWFAAQHLGASDILSLPAHALEMDTQGFYQAGEKFGLGSSAALATALYVGTATLLGKEPSLEAAIAVHRASQDNQGSGIDVAASFFGGLLHFHVKGQVNGQATRQSWPNEVYWRAIWTGHSASTPAHLARYRQWRASGKSEPVIDKLMAACEQCAQGLSLDSLADYIERLREFDQASGVGVYDQGHANLHKLAMASGVVYKPCGAGGGDLGIALAQDPRSLEEFVSRAQAQGFVETQLELAQHGVEATRGHHISDT